MTAHAGAACPTPVRACRVRVDGPGVSSGFESSPDRGTSSDTVLLARANAPWVGSGGPGVNSGLGTAGGAGAPGRPDRRASPHVGGGRPGVTSGLGAPRSWAATEMQGALGAAECHAGGHRLAAAPRPRQIGPDPRARLSRSQPCASPSTGAAPVRRLPPCWRGVRRLSIAFQSAPIDSSVRAGPSRDDQSSWVLSGSEGPAHGTTHLHGRFGGRERTVGRT